MGLLPGTGSIGQRMSAARVELANLEQQIVAAHGALNAMRGQLAATPQTLPGIDGGTSTASGQLAQLEGQLNRYLAQRLDRLASRRDHHPPADRAAAPVRRAGARAAAAVAASRTPLTSRCAR